MNNFIDLLKRAFALWWRFKILWPLGMLAALVGHGDGGAGGNFNVSQQFSADDPTAPPWLTDLIESRLVRDIIANPWPYVAGLITVVVIWSIVAALIGALAHGAMIRVADVADQGYAANIGDGLRVGAARMLPIFLLNLILALPAIIILGVVAAVVGFSVAGLIASANAGGGPADPGPLIASIFGLLFCVVGVVLLLAVIGALLGVWARLAQRVCVIELRGPLASLGRAWRLIAGNLGLTLLTWLFQAVLGGVVGFVLAIPALVIAFPAIIAAAQGGALSLGVIVALIVYAILAGVLVGGILTAFNSAMWTVMYRAFAAREQAPVPYGAPA